MAYSLDELFKDSSHKTSLFTPEEINYIENLIYLKNIKGAEVPYIKCLIRDKEIRLTPEEAVRQLYVYKLIHEYGYKKEQIALEHGIQFGRETKRADIVIFEKSRPTVEYIIIEVKKPKLKEGKEQLKSYCNATGATMGVWTNGQQISFYRRKDPNYFEDIPNIPKAAQKLKDILTERWLITTLIQNDKLFNERKSLKNLIEEMEDEVLANAGVDVFEEVFKLIYTKLYDELASTRDKLRYLEFRNYGDTDEDLKKSIENLFEKAKDKWPGVFSDNEKISLTPSHLAICVASLESVKLFNSNLDVVDDAFEYLMNKSQKGEKGQFFTPRYVIDMCVRMLNPGKNEKMIDTAAGSCGFPVHTIFYVWKKILEEKGLPQSHLFTAEKKPPECEDYVVKNVFAIDFDDKAVRVARTLNLIAGDGRTNVLHLNTLDYDRWQEVINTEDWRASYNDGWQRFMKLRACRDENNAFNFDIVMANPPFAGDIKESKIIAKYELGKNSKGKYQSKVGRDVLFIERNLNFLRPGGRMAVILPQGRFNNSSDKYIRDFIMERCRILAVVGLHGNVFKPHTGTKTSVLFVQKWDDKLCPKREDYPIFFATMQKPSKDNSGDKIYCIDENGAPRVDNNGHMIVEHDLFNHEGKTQDGIAEAFIEFAKRENLSFFVNARPFDEEKYKNLMGGLECCEVMLSEIDLGDRFDAEYFSKLYIEIKKRLEKKHTVKIKNIATTVASAFYPAATQLYSIGDLAFVRCVDCVNYPVITKEQDANFEKIPRDFAMENKGISILKKNEIVITKVGTPCYSSIINDYDEIALSRTVLGLKNIHGISPNYLMIFLRSKYGFEQLLRQRELTIQYQLTLPRVQDINIFLPSEKLQDNIAVIVEKYYAELRTSIQKYSSACDILQKELGLETFTPSTKNTAEKSLSEVFKTGRLDAEYFMPKYEEILELLKKFRTQKLIDIVNIKKSIEPGSECYGDEGIPFIRVSDVSVRGINEPSIKIPEKFIPNIASFYPCKDTILFSKDGSIGIAYKVPEDMKAVTSGALLHLKIKNSAEVLPDYLVLVLNSQAVQLQAERDSNGAIIQHWRIEDIKNVTIPILSMKIQNEISARVQESFKLRRKSEELIKTAVRAVEIAIEENEEKAMEYISLPV